MLTLIYSGQMIDEFALLGGGWIQAGSKGEPDQGGSVSLEHELRQRPDLSNHFSALFNSVLADGADAAFTVRGERFLVVRRTWNSFCMISKFRRNGIVVCHLPAGMLLVCAFSRPVLAQQAVPAVESVCALLWR